MTRGEEELRALVYDELQQITDPGWAPILHLTPDGGYVDFRCGMRGYRIGAKEQPSVYRTLEALLTCAEKFVAAYEHVSRYER